MPNWYVIYVDDVEGRKKCERYQTRGSENAMEMDTRKALQADLLAVFERYGVSVAVGITATGVMIGSQDERVDASNLGDVHAQPATDDDLVWAWDGFTMRQMPRADTTARDNAR